MVVHLVLFRPRADLAPADRARLIDALTTALREIPSIRGARVGRRITTGRPYELLMRADYPYMAMLEFDDEAGLRAYLEHAAHDALATRFFEAFEEALIYDYELEPLTGESVSFL